MQQDETINQVMRRTKRAKESFIKEMTIMIKTTGEEPVKAEILVTRNKSNAIELGKDIETLLVK